MEPLIAVAAGLACLVAGAVVLRSFGTGYRVGRLLAGIPSSTIEHAEALAAAGARRYLRIEGRLDSDVDFPDEHDRPLVFRRRRLEVLRNHRWAIADEIRQVVPFEIREGLASIAVDGEAIDVGLVVLPRESLGTVADLEGQLAGQDPPDTPVRLRIEQVSSIEHATVLGVPLRRPDGTTILTAGLGRPLILSTLERTEAMQILAGGRRARPLIALVLLALGIGLAVLGVGWEFVRVVTAVVDPSTVLAASPSPPGSPVAGSSGFSPLPSPLPSSAGAGDTRSAGQGPGLVGAPLAAILLVALIAIASIAITLGYVRLTAGRTPRPPGA